ncbi:hypothetical protein [Streptomyces sp. Ac-502]|uniref:hypothetical protein n=1 Tax=Streptomyces sp. Ac-502 TaxID=3342801 RepID=UPI0038625E28
MDHEPIRHGYTAIDIDQLARLGISMRPYYRGLDDDERYAAAWHAIVEHIYSADEWPSGTELITVAAGAADAVSRRSLEHQGVPRGRGEHYQGRADTSRFHAYWESVARPTASPETPIVERTALIQIWPQLTTQHQTALHALALHEDYQAAADALGLRLNTFYRHVRLARLAVLTLWWEGETPRRGWRDRRAKTEPTQLKSVSAHIRKRHRAGVA